jgi:polyisoprenoid-binding protein YceI
MHPELARRAFLLGGAGCAVVRPALANDDKLKIGSPRGTIDFAIGDSKVFRTTGGFKTWQGQVMVDDENVPRSAVEVTIATTSIEMLDSQQTAMLKDIEFFDVSQFPTMLFRSTAIERSGETALKVLGNVTLRGITKPMMLNVSVTERRPDAPPGKRYALFRAEGSIKRSDFGMIKYLDIVGDTVDISIRTDAWR